ncbi:MAG TPA: hypothetical protein GX010_04195 [Erysipelotrichaceae bacterium]|nr:hypothetical protein [Erysipelotrichaceae bacterium]
MIEEVAQVEKNTRKIRFKNRMLWFLISLNLILFGYLVYEIVMIIITLSAK